MVKGKLVGEGICKGAGHGRRKGEQDAMSVSHHTGLLCEVAAQHSAHRITHTLQPPLLPLAAFMT